MGGKWIIKFSSNKDKQEQIDKPLHVGDYKQTNINGVEILTENFSTSPICTDVRTINLEVHSSMFTARNFISKLDLTALTRMIQDL